MKLAVFDVDSTLVDAETIEKLAKLANCEDKVREVTARAMQGELDFFESLTYRVGLLKGVDVEKVNEICRNLPIMNGAKETIAALKDKGYKAVCFSGGFQNATIPLAEKLGLDAQFSNILHEKDGKLTGLVGGEMMFNNSKSLMLQKIQKLLDISPKETIAVGDGANDLGMFKHAKTKIAFCAKPILKENANVIIDTKDLREILKYI